MIPKLNRRAETSEFPIILILVIVAAIILFIIFFPMIKDIFIEFLKLLGLAQEKDSFIRSFEVEQGLEGSLIFRYRFINDQLTASYELKSSAPTGEKTLGVIDVLAEELVTGEKLDESKRKEYLVDGNEIKYTLPAPSALDPKVYNLYALDSSGKVLQKKTVDWPGVFDEQDKYLPQITTFMDFAEGIKGLGSSKTANLLSSDGVVMLGFSSDFNNGAGAWPLLRLFGCGKEDVAMPKECADVKSCLCLCRKAGDAKQYCAERGRICYGYDDFDFIGGPKKTCGILTSLFDNNNQNDGEYSSPVNIYKGAKFDDPNGEFNSLAIVKNDGGVGQMPLKLTPKQMSPTAGGSVSALIISK